MACNRRVIYENNMNWSKVKNYLNANVTRELQYANLETALRNAFDDILLFWSFSIILAMIAAIDSS